LFGIYVTILSRGPGDNLFGNCQKIFGMVDGGEEFFNKILTNRFGW
jgi:hypothetical protein